MKKKLPVFMIGSGGHASVVLDILTLNKIKIAGIIQNKSVKNKKFRKYKVISEESFLSMFKFNEALLINGVGQIVGSKQRQKLTEKFVRKKYKFISAIHPISVVDHNIKLPPDIQIMAGVVVNSGCEFGNNCILNTRCIVDHDCKIRSNTHIAPGAVLCGNVEIGPNSFIGANSTVIHGIKIKANSLIAAGTTVKKKSKISKNIFS